MQNFTRRHFLQTAAATSAAIGVAAPSRALFADDKPDPPPDKSKPTKFQIACMTLPYSQFPLERALYGIKSAGFHHIAWGTTHKEDGKPVPVMAKDAPPEKARELAKRCRD